MLYSWNSALIHGKQVILTVSVLHNIDINGTFPILVKHVDMLSRVIASKLIIAMFSWCSQFFEAFPLALADLKDPLYSPIPRHCWARNCGILLFRALELDNEKRLFSIDIVQRDWVFTNTMIHRYSRFLLPYPAIMPYKCRFLRRTLRSWAHEFSDTHFSFLVEIV